MKILYVLGGNSPNSSLRMFVEMEAKYLQRVYSVNYSFFFIQGKGWKGYLRNLPKLRSFIKKEHPDIINANYGFSGLLSCLQFKVPVISTFHGSDIHQGKRNLYISKIAMHLSTYNVFVSNWIYNISHFKGANFSIISAPLDLSEIFFVEKTQARKKLGLDLNTKYVLFSSAFDNEVKNSSLALNAVHEIPNCQLIELKGYTRVEINLLLNACDVQLTTSFHESGPMIVKEAIAAGLPVVSTAVGEVPILLKDFPGNYISSYNQRDVVNNLLKALHSNIRTKGHERIKELGMDIESVCSRKYQIYKNIING